MERTWGVDGNDMTQGDMLLQNVWQFVNRLTALLELLPSVLHLSGRTGEVILGFLFVFFLFEPFLWKMKVFSLA